MRRGLGILRGAAVATVLVAPAAALPGSQLDADGPGYEASEIDLELELIALRKALVEDYEGEPWDVDWVDELDEDLADLDLDDLDFDDLDLDGGSTRGEPSPVADSLTSSGIPDVALDAYHRAEASTAATDSRCGLRWSLVAAIGRVESNHGRHGGSQLDADGNAKPPILGLPLDGRGDVALISDTDGGNLDNDTTYDRAVGPMQFIPTTWKMMEVDGNGDGLKDPHNIYDAALAAAHYLCSGEVDLRHTDQLQAAVYRYNRSDEYVNLVLSLAAAYERGEYDAPVGDPGPGITSEPTGPADLTPVDVPANVGVPPGVQEPPSEADGTRPAPPRRDTRNDTVLPTPAPTPDPPSRPGPSRPSGPPVTDPPSRPSTTTSTTTASTVPTTTVPTTTTTSSVPPTTTTTPPPTTEPPTTTVPPTTTAPTTTVPSTTEPPATTESPDTTVPGEPDPDEPVCPEGFQPLPSPESGENGTEGAEGTDGGDDEAEGNDDEGPICCAVDENRELPASADEDDASCCVGPTPEAPAGGDEVTEDGVTNDGVTDNQATDNQATDNQATDNQATDELTEEEGDIPDCCALAAEGDTAPATAEDGTPLCPELVAAIDGSAANSRSGAAGAPIFFALVALSLLAVLPPTYLLTHRLPTQG